MSMISSIFGNFKSKRERGVGFKKGRQKQEKGEKPNEKYMICK